LLTGSGGFIGSHVLEHIFTATTWQVLATDSFRHKGKADRIAQMLEPRPDWRPRLEVTTHDLQAPFTDQMIYRMGPVDYVIAMASESHVDRSIDDPVSFIRNNVNVILSTLEFCRTVQPKHVMVISTDEVYGPEPIVGGVPVPHPEWAPIVPSNPYSASKAAQEAIATAYWRTFGVPVTIINCMNLIGERQDPEKFVPMLIRGIASGEEVTIHGREGDIGTRHYLHARNLADALVYILKNLPPAMYGAHAKAGLDRPAYVADRPDRYNIVGPDRIDNLVLAQTIAGIVGRPLKYRLLDFHSARPGHDPHYGLAPEKLAKAGWTPPVPFDESLIRTVRWSLDHPEWLL
jgi:dTDP-glucose 4,6-dehydratase